MMCSALKKFIKVVSGSICYMSLEIISGVISSKDQENIGRFYDLTLMFILVLPSEIHIQQQTERIRLENVPALMKTLTFTLRRGLPSCPHHI